MDNKHINRIHNDSVTPVTMTMESPILTLEDLKKQLLPGRKLFTKKEVFDKYLEEKFNTDLYGIMMLYTNKHLGQSFSLPVPSVICVTYLDVHNAEEINSNLDQKLSLVQRTLSGETRLNLHSDKEYTVYIVNYDPQNDSLCFGYSLESGNKTMFVRASAQFDIAIISQF